jgi:hypothetical protein
MNASRKSLVTRAFNKLDRTGDSLITVEDLKDKNSTQPEIRVNRESTAYN